jgi:hypothetical protein
MPATGSGRKRGNRKQGGDIKLADTRLDGTLDQWPSEPPRAPRRAVAAPRLALIQSPGTVHHLAWKLNDVGRGARIATGSFDARRSSTRRRRSGAWRHGTCRRKGGPLAKVEGDDPGST